MPKSKKTKRIDIWVKRHTGTHFCSCGCGEIVEVLRKHYSMEVPKFVKGHNMNGPYNPQTENLKPKESSYWDNLTEEEKERRLSQLKSFPRGEDHPNWSGGKYLTDSGYIYTLVNDHPYSVNNYIAEHRLNVEKWMRKNNPNHEFMEIVDGFSVLRRDKIIHHRNKIKTCNDLDNLIIMDSQATHIRWHSILDKTNDEINLFDKFKNNIFCPWIEIYAKK
jgi:hypothetical protein